MPRSSLSLLITCEHASNFIPERWQPAFQGCEALLESHRGWDPGALELSAAIQRQTAAPLIRGEASRLLVELNRSENHPQLFSEISSGFDSQEKRLLMERLYRPYRQDVHDAVNKRIQQGASVLHLSVHTFTPVWEGTERDVDVGVLFDPGRQPETDLAGRLRDFLSADASLRVRDNQPYKGTDDGLTAYLRTCFPQAAYSGLELEVSQRFPYGDPAVWKALQETISRSIASVLA